MGNINITIIKASEGHKLTNGDVICSVVQLSQLDSVSNWKEITDAEADEINQQRELEREKEFEDMRNNETKPIITE